MSRIKTVIKNAIWELGYYLIVIVLGFLAPRYIILIYGSEVNGLSSTITQILNIILILQSGATTASIFSLYKHIANDDFLEISKNVYSAEKFFRKISVIFACIMLVAAFLTAKFIDSQLETVFIFLAFVIMGLKSFLDLYFTSKFRIVFTAFQEKFVISIATLIEQIVYYALVFLTLFTRSHYVFIYVWLFIGCVVKVVYLDIKYRRKYGKIIPKCAEKEPGKIKGRSYSLANEVSHSVVSSSITIILSFMYGLQEASVYAVYALVSQALNLVVTALHSAFAPSFGNLVASENKENAKRVFHIFQFIYVMLNSIMYYCMIVLLVPFVKIYTAGATDIDYMNPMLACLLGLQGIFSAFRIPYNILVSSCGYFKETWKQPVVCAVLSIIISCAAGKYAYGFILLGPTLFYLVNFLYQHFRIRKIAPYLISGKAFVMLLISMIGFGIAVMVCKHVAIPEGIIAWVVGGMVYTVCFFIYVAVVSKLLLPEESKASIVYIKHHLKRGR